ncbi:hypothetical protein FACS1894132_08680 [Clostridia bacterium]|nr:hypothetical protein FACS1894132_08680 [Clostridia bacterium]
MTTTVSFDIDKSSLERIYELGIDLKSEFDEFINGIISTDNYSDVDLDWNAISIAHKDFENGRFSSVEECMIRIDRIINSAE